MKTNISLLASAILFFFFAGCDKVVEIEPIVKYINAFNTSVQVSVYDTTLNKGRINASLNDFESELKRIAKEANSSDEDGLLYKLNHSKKLRWDLPDDLREMIIHGIKWGKKTDGLFDITIEPLTRLYNWGDDFSPPDSMDIKKALRRVNYKKLRWEGKKLYRGNAQIDLDYIVKGYALMTASKILIQRNIDDFLINAGGVIQFNWTHPDVPATIYVRHPRKAGTYFGSFKLNHSCGLATAADYQNYQVVRGKRYHHYLSPFTGEPTENCVAVTVKAANAFVANFYADELFLMGHRKAKNAILDNHSIEAILIWEENGQLRHWVSPGFEPIFELYEQ